MPDHDCGGSLVEDGCLPAFLLVARHLRLRLLPRQVHGPRLTHTDGHLGGWMEEEEGQGEVERRRRYRGEGKEVSMQR